MYTLKEYVDQQGFVFAVTWRGMLKPELSEVFGSYFSDFAAINDNLPRAYARAPVQVQTKDIISISEGHPRDWRGRAYVLSRVPSGFNLEDLQ